MNGNNTVWMAAALSNVLAGAMDTDELNWWGNVLAMVSANLLAVASLRPPDNPSGAPQTLGKMNSPP
jgi:hypothetical protein